MARINLPILECYHSAWRTIFDCPRDITLHPRDDGYHLGMTGSDAANSQENDDMTTLSGTLDLTPWGASADRLLKEPEAAEFLRQKPTQWRYKSRGPAFQKLGGRVVYRLSELVRFVQQA